MNDEDQFASSDEGKKKTFDLDALLPEKASVATSIGMLYVRHLYSSDWKYLESDDAVELGRSTLQRLCNRTEDKSESSPLLDEDMRLLNDADYQVLAQAIAKQNGWRDLHDGPSLKDLGEVIKEEKRAITERHGKMLRDLRKSIDSSYSFLNKGTLEKLQEQMAGIADIRRSFASTESLQAALRAAKLPDESLRKLLASARIESPKTYEVPKSVLPPRFEDTSMGRATLESANNTRQVATKMNDLVAVVAGLNQTIVQDVLPAWFKTIEEDQKAAKEAFDQAARGLWWTKWAVIASVLVAIGATLWQVDVAKSIDRENFKQQIRAETILREQLAAQQRLMEQQAKEAEAMREAIATMKEPIPSASPSKSHQESTKLN